MMKLINEIPGPIMPGISRTRGYFAESSGAYRRMRSPIPAARMRMEATGDIGVVGIVVSELLAAIESCSTGEWSPRMFSGNSMP